MIALQRNYTAKNTPEMKERGELIRHRLPTVFREVLKTRYPEWSVQGRDATGQKSRVPWVRFYDRRYSRTARFGWYLVYLVHEDGSGVTLSLNQGTTELLNGAYKQLPTPLLKTRVDWARNRLPPPGTSRPSTPTIAIGKGSLARAYERGNILGVTYLGELPEENSLLADLHVLLGLLDRLYEVSRHTPPPGTPDPGLVALVDQIDAVAGRKPQGGAPRRSSPEERAAIEQHAMFLARELLESDGWALKDVHKTKPYDFLAKRFGQKLYVEVKGTTTDGASVLLTGGEVKHHLTHPGESCLIVVRDIILMKDVDEPTCTGGIREMWLPWSIADSQLAPMAYQYRVKPPSPSITKSAPEGVRTRGLKKPTHRNG